MCQLCQEANKLSRLRLTDLAIVLVYDGYDFMSFPKKLFEGVSIRDYEKLVQKFLAGPNEWKLRNKETNLKDEDSGRTDNNRG